MYRYTRDKIKGVESYPQCMCVDVPNALQNVRITNHIMTQITHHTTNVSLHLRHIL